MTDLQSSLDPGRQADIRRMLVAQATPASSRNRRLVLASACAAVVVATGVTVLVTYPDPPPADYGGWTAVPQAAPPLTAPDEDIDQWASKCSDLGVGGVGIQGVPPRREAAARREVLVDRRGGFTFCVDVALGNGTATDPLIALSGVKEPGRNGLNSSAVTVFDKPFTRPAPGTVLVLGGSWQSLPPPREPGTRSIEAFQMYGLSGATVTGVDVLLANGLKVTATLRGGIWGVWWPSERGASTGARLLIHTPTGVTTVDPHTVQLEFD
jgi:hypothetical protein